jgi:glycosyltransferase involved in cell wall biosynthesis
VSACPKRMLVNTVNCDSSNRIQDRGETARNGAHQPIRAAILCDIAEEGWPSMDLVGDMLSRGLEEHCGLEVATTQVRPRMQRRLSRMGGPANGLAWNADRLMNRFADYPRWLRTNREHYDLFHIVDHSYSQLIHYLPRERTVVTCHDLDTFRCLLEPEREKRPVWFRAMCKRILAGFQTAAHVITVSAATRDELLQHHLFPEERITVIPNGVDSVCSAEPNPASDAAAAKLLGIADGIPLLLSVGSTIPRKRLDVLLRAFAKVRAEFPAARLVRVGGLTPEHEQLAKDLGVENAVTTVRFLDRETLAAVYRRAWLLLHTSDAEGFGLPVIEAMACGCPVVASDLPVLREAGGTAASYCRVADVNAWHDLVSQLLRQRFQRPGDWEARRRQALAWAKRFSWAENARQTAAIYERLCASPSSADQFRSNRP